MSRDNLPEDRSMMPWLNDDHPTSRSQAMELEAALVRRLGPELTCVILGTSDLDICFSDGLSALVDHNTGEVATCLQIDKAGRGS